MDRIFFRRRVASVAVVVLVLLAVPAGAGALGGPAAPSVPDRYVVRAGDTLWDVATQVAPDDDPQETVARLMRENALQDGSIVPGQVLVVALG